MVAFSRQSPGARYRAITLAVRWRSEALIVAATIAVLSVAGCNLSVDNDNAISGFANVVGNEIDRDMDGKVNESISDPEVGTVVMATGYSSRWSPGAPWDYDGTNLETSYAYAGIAPGFDVGEAVYAGTTTYSGRYTFVAVDYEATSIGILGTPITDSGLIDLNADFIAGTLTGETADLTVNGSINGDGLSGTVRVRYNSFDSPMVATLDGFIGETGTIGAFHGNDNETALAGGFVGTAE